MSNQKKKQPQVYFSPKGRTEWLKIFTPDTKFNPDGDFGGKLIIDQCDATDLMAALDVMFEKAIDAAVEETGKARDKIRTNDPYEINPETGDVSLKFKLKAIVHTKAGDSFNQKPLVVDANRTPITKEIPLWNGSLVRVGYQVIPYYTALAGAGLSLRMKSVQVIESVEGSSESASGFDAEDGYSFNANDVSPEGNFDKQEDGGDEYEYDDVPF